MTEPRVETAEGRVTFACPHCGTEITAKMEIPPPARETIAEQAARLSESQAEARAYARHIAALEAQLAEARAAAIEECAKAAERMAENVRVADADEPYSDQMRLASREMAFRSAAAAIRALKDGRG